MPAKETHNVYTTLFIAVTCLVLGIPFGGLAINLEGTFMVMPNLADPAALIQGSHIALLAAAFITIGSCITIMLGSVSMRHMTPGNVVVAFITFGTACANLAAQFILLSVVYVLVFTHRESKSRVEVSFQNGVYDTNGRQFTREVWSCMMGNLYLSQEPWATNACSEYHYARYLTLIMAANAILLLIVSFWPVRSTLFMSARDREMVKGKA